MPSSETAEVRHARELAEIRRLAIARDEGRAFPPLPEASIRVIRQRMPGLREVQSAPGCSA